MKEDDENRGGRGGRAEGAIAAAVAFLVSAIAGAQEIPKAPVPPSPFLPVVYRYADTLIAKGRDTYGPQKTGLFLSALDRAALAPLATRPPAPEGVQEGDRVGSWGEGKGGPLVGANLQHDENLLRLLYTLSELSGKPIYRDAADGALKWFLENAPSPATHLLPWGKNLSWDILKDEPIAADGSAAGTHEFFRPWLLWDRSFDLAPEPSARAALGIRRHLHDLGTFNGRATFRETSGVFLGMTSPRHGGFFIRTWAVAHARTKDERFLKAIEAVLGRYEASRRAGTGLIMRAVPSVSSSSDLAEDRPAESLSLAIDCHGAAHRAPEPLAGRLRAFAAREDEIFCALPHELKRTGGFVESADAATGEPTGPHTARWSGRYPGHTTAQVALLCVSRYENTGKVAYRELIHAAADLYLDSLPGEKVDDAWPATFGHAISLELAAWRSTARQAYLDCARKLANRAVEQFFGSSPLPRASLKTDHYESITGADTLALALVELHLQILAITAVRCPPNSADR